MNVLLENMKVIIPGLKAFGEHITTADTLRILVCLLEYKVSVLKVGKIENCADDIDEIGLQIVAKTLRSLRTLVKVCSSDQDYVSACALLRMITDNISVYKLIYTNEDSVEKEYRHYLYVLDGISMRESLMLNDIEDEGHISQKDLEKLQRQYKEIRQSDSSVKQLCIDILNRHSYAVLYPDFHKQSLSSRNWKFKDKICVKEINRNKYSWQELYSGLNIKKDVVKFLSSFLSQFVHGLIISNISVQETDDEFEPILSIAIALLSTIQKDLETRCPNSDELFSGFISSKWGREMLQYIDPEQIIKNYSKE